MMCGRRINNEKFFELLALIYRRQLLKPCIGAISDPLSSWVGMNTWNVLYIAIWRYPSHIHDTKSSTSRLKQSQIFEQVWLLHHGTCNHIGGLSWDDCKAWSMCNRHLGCQFENYSRNMLRSDLDTPYALRTFLEFSHAWHLRNSAWSYFRDKVVMY